MASKRQSDIRILRFQVASTYFTMSFRRPEDATEATMGTRLLPTYQTIHGLPVMAAYTPEMVRQSMTFLPDEGDIVLVSYPKCGTHWMMQIAQLILHRGESATGRRQFYMQALPLEMFGTGPLAAMKRPRLVQTHLPFDEKRYNKNAKYIYMTRNPWDCCVSFFYHTKSLPVYDFRDGTFDDFFEVFVNGETDYGDYFDHVLSWYKRRDESNVFFLTYEDLKNNTRDKIIEIAGFLGDEYKTMLTEDEKILEQVLEKSSVEYMKRIVNASDESIRARLKADPGSIPDSVKRVYLDSKGRCGGTTLVRKGEVGDSKDMFTAEQMLRMRSKVDEWNKESGVLSLWKEEDVIKRFY